MKPLPRQLLNRDAASESFQQKKCNTRYTPYREKFAFQLIDFPRTAQEYSTGNVCTSLPSDVEYH